MEMNRCLFWPLVSMLLLAGHTPALPAPAKVKARMGLETSYQDNPLLLSSGAEGTLHHRLTPAVSIKWKTRDVELDMGLDLAINKFSGDGRKNSASGDLDSFDQKLNGGLSFEDARHELSFSWGLNRDTTRSSELTDSGLLQENAQRLSANVGAKWDHSLTALDQLSLTGDANIVEFDTSSLSNYKGYNVGGRYSRKLGPKQSAGLSTGATIFDPSSNSGSPSTSFRLNAFWENELTQAVSVNLSGGASYTVREGDGSGADALGFVADTGLSWSLTRSSALNASYSRSITPSSTGSLQESDNISLGFHHNLTREIAMDVQGSWQRQESALGGNNSVRNFYSLNPSITWRPLRDWRLSLSYNHLRQVLAGAAGDASSNTIFFRLGYAFPERSLF